MTTMERCSPVRKALEAVRAHISPELITELEYLIEEEEDAIITAYEDAVDFVVLGIMMNEDWPTADEYFEEIFTP